VSKSNKALCKKQKRKDLHTNIYEALSDYYNYVDSDNANKPKDYVDCIIKTRQYIEKYFSKLNEVELEMLYLIDKMFLDLDKKIDEPSDWLELKVVVKNNVKAKPHNKDTGSIQNMSKFELLFDSITLNTKLENAKSKG